MINSTPKTIFSSAAGRVNLIGEHTDYNGGFVLPIGIPQRTSVRLTPQNSRQVRIKSLNMKVDDGHFEYELGKERATKHWADYIQGVTAILAKEGFLLQGFDAEIQSDVPMGSGLSSSAALEVSLMRALREAFNLKLDDVSLARLGQKVENDFVGARVGIMDQMAASLADQEAALFLDTRNFVYERVALPKGCELLVINSGVSHQNAHGAPGANYNTRRSECESACAQLKIHELRDLGLEDLPKLDTLPEVIKRRARHVITENARVLAAVEIMKEAKPGAVEKLGKLFYESHVSQRDDYTVSVPEIDLLVELAIKDADVFGARLTGGGFGGSIVVLTKEGKAEAVGQRILQAYKLQGNKSHPTVLVP